MNFYFWVVAVIFVKIYAAEADYEAPVYNLNLDLPPKERWSKIMVGYRKYVPLMDKIYREQVNSPMLIGLVTALGERIDDYLPAPYAEEIRGVAEGLNYSLGEIVWLNLFYDFTAYCTSIVGVDEAGMILHGRNLDYNFTDALRVISIQVNFQRNNKTIYIGSTWAGYVGLTTVVKPNAFTISMNERDQGGLWRNLIVALLDKKARMFANDIRTVAEQAQNFSSAVTMLSLADTIAEGYFIVGGLKGSEGVVITKNRIGVADVWNIDVTAGRWYLLQTNYDHWVPPPASDDRRDPGNKNMRAMGRANFTMTNMYNEVLSMSPNLNPTTAYTVLMSASYPNSYKMMIRTPRK